MNAEPDFSARVYRALAWSAGLRVGSQVITWVITLVLVRLLTPADYGLMAAASFYFGLLIIIRELGLPSAVIQQRLEGETLGRVFGAVLCAHWLLFAIVMLAAPWFAALAGQERLTDLLRVIALPLLIMAFGTIGRTLLQRALDFRRIAIVELMSAVLNALVALGFALAGFGVWALVAGLVTQYTANTVLFLLWSPDRVRPRFDLVKLLPQLRFGSNIFLSSICATGAGTLPALAIGRSYGPTSAGLWAVAGDLADTIAGRVMPIIAGVAFPAIAEMQSQAERVRHYFSRGGALVGFAMFPILFGLAATSTEIIPLVLGAQWVEAALICSLICIRAAFTVIAVLLPPLLVGLGRPDVALLNSAWRLGLTIAAVLLFLPSGIEMFAIALLVVEVALVLNNFRNAAPLLQVSTWRMASYFAPSLCNAALMALAVWGLGRLLPESWNLLTVVSVKVAAGITAYLLLALLSDRETVATAHDLAKRSIGAARGRAGRAPVLR